jgi:hypothetical protein
MARQFLIQIDNKPGELAHLARALAMRGVNIHHLSCVGAGLLSCVFLIPDDEQAMRDVLDGLGHAFIEGDALYVEVDDRPGGLAEVAERLASAGVNILATVCVGRRPGVARMAFTVDNEALAREVLDNELVPQR